VRKRRSRRRRTLDWNIAGILALAALGAFLFVTSLVAFLDGRFVSGRTGSSGDLDAWREYGAAAYAGESPIHLVTSAAGLSALIWCAALLHARVRRAPTAVSWATALSLGILVLSSAAALTLLIANWVTGVPFHNFRPTGADHLLYALWCLVPLMVLAATTYGIATIVRAKPAPERSPS
jgi:hypothetical protein